MIKKTYQNIYTDKYKQPIKFNIILRNLINRNTKSTSNNFNVTFDKHNKNIKETKI